MGLESYLFSIEFETAVDETEVIPLFEKIGLTHLSERYRQRSSSQFGDIFFELRSPKGLTEIHVLQAPEEVTVKEFSLRFSVVSPASVIDQTFQLLDRLNEERPIIVFDTEVKNHTYRRLRQEGQVDTHFKGLTEEQADEVQAMCRIPLDAEEFKANKLALRKREVVLKNQQGAIVEGGEQTFRHVQKQGLFDKYFGWIKKEL